MPALSILHTAMYYAGLVTGPVLRAPLNIKFTIMLREALS